ncbi:hypothetical protein DE146DRAFT_174430 [Phaeosphaeria sp. MPI-PUGE-AT-0046c]|nr:hypothetical protein DE146DRAFT_174430 [Phaeosphaeria sp. MPI-PUGE-AT-0046c]
MYYNCHLKEAHHLNSVWNHANENYVGDHSTEKEKAYSGDASELVKLIEENTKQVRFESYRANSRVEDRIRVAKREKERAEARENQVQQTGNDVSSMEEKMPNTSLLAVAQARQQNPRKLHERGYGQHFPAVAAAAKRQMKTKKSFDFSLEGAALLGRRGKKLEPDASLPSPSVSTGYEAAGEGDVQPNTQDYQKQAENKQGTLEPPFLTSHRSSLMGALHEGESEVTLQDLAAGKLTRQSNHGSSSKPTSGQRTEIVSVHSRSASISQLRPPPVNTERAPGAIFGRARTQAPPPVSFPSIFNTSPKSARDSAADLENPFATSASALPVSSDPWDARNQPKNSMSTTSNHEAGTHSRNDTIPLDTGHKTLQATFFARLTRDTQVGPGAIRRGNITPLSVKDEGYTASHQDIGEGNNTRRSSLPNTVFKPSSGKGTEIDIEAKEFRRKNVKALGIHEPAPTTAPTTVDHNAIRTLQDIMKARREREEQNRRKAEQEHMKNAERRARPAGLGGHTPSSSQKATQAAQLRYNETRRPDSSVYQPLYMVERLRSSSSSPLLPELPNGISLGEWGPSDDEAGAFQSTVVRAFDEGGSSDSDASFIYDSALPLDQIPYRCRKSDARTPSMTSLSSLTKPPSVIEDTHDNPGKSSSIEFACSSIPVGDRELTERCKGTLPIGTGQFRQSSHHHHIVGKQEDVSVNVDEDEVDALLKDWTTVF